MNWLKKTLDFGQKIKRLLKKDHLAKTWRKVIGHLVAKVQF